MVTKDLIIRLESARRGNNYPQKYIHNSYAYLLQILQEVNDRKYFPNEEEKRILEGLIKQEYYFLSKSNIRSYKHNAGELIKVFIVISVFPALSYIIADEINRIAGVVFLLLTTGSIALYALLHEKEIENSKNAHYISDLDGLVRNYRRII